MSKNNKIKVLRGILGSLSGSTTPITISKNGVITIQKKLRSLTKK